MAKVEELAITKEAKEIIYDLAMMCCNTCEMSFTSKGKCVVNNDYHTCSCCVDTAIAIYDKYLAKPEDKIDVVDGKEGE